MQYIGEFEVDINYTPFKDYTPSDWAVYFAECYGQIDGGHHKTWVIDHMVRCIKGTPVKLTQARWIKDDGNIHTEYRVNLAEPSDEYVNFIKEYEGEVDEDGYKEYEWDVGIAP